MNKEINVLFTKICTENTATSLHLTEGNDVIVPGGVVLNWVAVVECVTVEGYEG